jgi:hypothetical protein
MRATGESTPTPTGTTRRWWTDPILVRWALDSTTPGSTSPSPSESLPAVARTDRSGIDLDDPQQREFGDYELIEEIGRGGMGCIYRARQRNLGREVAIKLLSAGLRASEALIESLRREAQNAALLQHPNIVVVHEMGDHAGLIYFAMQLVRGRSLSQCLLADGPMPPRDAATLLRTVAEAVDYAHRLGVLHLDLKPGNILIDGSGTPLVADFGLARRLEQALEVANDGVSGTPSYMAPEQARVHGAALSPATDVWALGAVLYELLTGQPPFCAGDPARTLQLLLGAHVRRPSRLHPVPADLEAICLKCLGKEPARRYASARALADDLGRYLDGRAVSVRPLNALQRLARWAQREPQFALAAGLVLSTLLFGIGITVVQWEHAEAHAQSVIARLWQYRRVAAAQLERDGDQPAALAQLLQNIREEGAAGRSDQMHDDLLRIQRLREVEGDAPAARDPARDAATPAPEARVHGGGGSAQMRRQT